MSRQPIPQVVRDIIDERVRELEAVDAWQRLRQWAGGFQLGAALRAMIRNLNPPGGGRRPTAEQISHLRRRLRGQVYHPWLALGPHTPLSDLNLFLRIRYRVATIENPYAVRVRRR